MRSPNRLILALALAALPTPLLAQTVAPADLVGTWVHTQMGGKAETWQILLALHADGTWTRVLKKNGQVVPSVPSVDGIGPGESGRWRFSGDTLWLQDPAVIDTLAYVLKDKSIDTRIGSKWALKTVLDAEKKHLFIYGYRGAYTNDTPPKPMPLTCMNSFCFERA